MALTLKHSIQGIERGIFDSLRARIDASLTEYITAWGSIHNMPSSMASRAFVGAKEEIPVQSQEWVRISLQRLSSVPLASIGESRDSYKLTLYVGTRSQIYKKNPVAGAGGGTITDYDTTLNTSQALRAKAIAECCNRIIQKYGITDLSSTYGVFNINEGIFSDYKPRETNASGCKVEITLQARGYDNSL